MKMFEDALIKACHTVAGEFDIWCSFIRCLPAFLAGLRGADPHRLATQSQVSSQYER
jgi:hypothetical protein